MPFIKIMGTIVMPWKNVSRCSPDTKNLKDNNKQHDQPWGGPAGNRTVRNAFMSAFSVYIFVALSLFESFLLRLTPNYIIWKGDNHPNLPRRLVCNCRQRIMLVSGDSVSIIHGVSPVFVWCICPSCKDFFFSFSHVCAKKLCHWPMLKFCISGNYILIPAICAVN